MSQFCTCSPTGTACPPDPTKHVNFIEGMVLGVDDFTQEFAYHHERDRTLARDLIGYGTVSGLKVSWRPDTREIAVSPGVALTPCGDLVRICEEQCALLNDWLTRASANDRPVEERLASHVEWVGSIPERWVRLYLVLRYQDCETDPVGILGEPCRTDTESVAASRRKDSFRLELWFQPPRQREEDAIRDVVLWLRQIPIITATPSDPGSDVADVLATFRDSAVSWTSPPSLPTSPPSDFLFGSPPTTLAISADVACEIWQAVFRVWVTELRPLWQLRCGGCGCQCGSIPSTESEDPESKPEPWVLLGEVRVPLSDANQVRDTNLVQLDDRHRPFVLHQRMIQEWILCSLGDQAAALTEHSALGGLANGDDHPQYLNPTRGDVRYAALGHTHALDALSDVTTGGAVENQVLTRVGTEWVPRTPASGVTDHGLLSGREDDDHPQYSTPTRGDVRYAALVHTHALDALSDVTTGGAVENQVLTRVGAEWVPRTPASGVIDHGLLSGREDDDHPQYLNPTRGDVRYAPVVHSHRLETLTDVSTPGPVAGDVLTHDGSQWIAQPGGTTTGGNFVERLAEFRFALVAAGIVGLDRERRPVYGELRAIGTDRRNPGSVTFSFQGYVSPPPRGGHQYIVKVLLVSDANGFFPTVCFGEFLPDNVGFTLIVGTVQGPLNEDQLLRLEFMIEVSQYGVGLPGFADERRPGREPVQPPEPRLGTPIRGGANPQSTPTPPIDLKRPTKKPK